MITPPISSRESSCLAITDLRCWLKLACPPTWHFYLWCMIPHACKWWQSTDIQMDKTSTEWSIIIAMSICDQAVKLNHHHYIWLYGNYQRRTWKKWIRHYNKAVAREPANEQASNVGSKGRCRVKRGCYFLPLGLELHPLCHSRDTGYCTNTHAWLVPIQTYGLPALSSTTGSLATAL